MELFFQVDLTGPGQLEKAAENVATAGGLFVPHEGHVDPFKDVMVVLQLTERAVAVPGTVVNIPSGGGGFYVHFKDGPEFDGLKAALPEYVPTASPPPVFDASPPPVFDASPPPVFDASPPPVEDPPPLEDPPSLEEEAGGLGSEIPDEELPDWLKEGIETLSEEDEPAESAEWQPSEEEETSAPSTEEEPPSASPAADDGKIPAWLREGINSLSEEEKDEVERNPDVSQDMDDAVSDSGEGINSLSEEEKDEPEWNPGVSQDMDDAVSDGGDGILESPLDEEVSGGEEPGKPEGRTRPTPVWGILDPTSDVPIHSQVRKLSLADKLKIARTANRPVRELLIRDTEKRLHNEVIRNPKITDEEIILYTAIPSLSPLVLEWVSMQPKHIRKRAVMLNIVQNPMTPGNTAKKLLSKLTEQELLRISRSSRVRQVISRAAKKMLMNKGVL